MSYVKFNGGVERTVPMDITDESDTELFNKLTALKLLKHDVKTNFRPQKFVTANDMIDMLLTDQYLFMKDDILSKFELDKKLIIVAKKEKNNIPKMLNFIKKYAFNVDKKCLIIDDEADFCRTNCIMKLNQ